jgi:phage shock protein A
MGYQLRMHNQVRDWLTGLRDTDPGLARQVGEAVLALLDAGDALGPPVVVPLESAVRRPEDPREALDFSYQRQLEILTKVRRGVADVATSRKRVELQAGSLEQQIARLASQREKARRAGREDLAEEARSRETAVQAQLAVLRRHHEVLTGEEERLTSASQRLQAKVEAFRVRKETIKASYTAAEASQSVREAFADISAATGDPELLPEEGAPPASAQAADAGDALLRDAGDLAQVSRGGAPPGDQDVVPPPPGMMLLLPGAPDDARAGLLFVVQPQGTAVLLAHVTGAGRSPEDYQAAIRAAVTRLPTVPARPATQPPPGEASPGPDTQPEAGEASAAPRAQAPADGPPTVVAPSVPPPAGEASAGPLPSVPAPAGPASTGPAPAKPAVPARTGLARAAPAPSGSAPAGRAGSKPAGRARSAPAGPVLPTPAALAAPAPAGEASATPASAGPASDEASATPASAGPASDEASATPASAGPASDAASADAFTSYDAESFLDEFFPGAETEVEIAAGALVARSRAHTLAEARQRMGLTQAQIARRMNVRQERVSAIERAEPGAAEVRTLAAYVRALGGRLEIVAHIGDERITLR